MLFKLLFSFNGATIGTGTLKKYRAFVFSTESITLGGYIPPF